MNRKIRFCAFLIGLNLLFIWGNSLLPGAISGALSDWLKELLGFLFPQGTDPSQGGGLLRKLMHFVEFCCLGILLSRLYRLLGKKNLLPPLFWGAAAACVDETIQRFVPDRGPSLRDVGIDTAGVCVGILLFLTGYQICKKKQKFNLEEMK